MENIYGLARLLALLHAIQCFDNATKNSVVFLKSPTVTMIYNAIHICCIMHFDIATEKNLITLIIMSMITYAVSYYDQILLLNFSIIPMLVFILCFKMLLDRRRDIR